MESFLRYMRLEEITYSSMKHDLIDENHEIDVFRGNGSFIIAHP